MTEKEYIFETLGAGNESPKRECVKESDLTQKHKDFLLGQLLSAFEYAPKEIQLKFLETIHKKQMHL